MSTLSTETERFSPNAAGDWIERIPEGAVSVETDGRVWRLRASRQLQTRFEDLLEAKKAGQLSEAAAREYEAICELDTLLSSLNRLARRLQSS